jgi:hypothetical protein
VSLILQLPVSVPLGLLVFFAVALHKIPRLTVASIAFVGPGAPSTPPRSWRGDAGVEHEPLRGGGALCAAGLHRGALAVPRSAEINKRRHPHGPGGVPGVLLHLTDCGGRHRRLADHWPWRLRSLLLIRFLLAVGGRPPALHIEVQERQLITACASLLVERHDSPPSLPAGGACARSTNDRARTFAFLRAHDVQGHPRPGDQNIAAGPGLISRRVQESLRRESLLQERQRRGEIRGI